MRLAAFKSIVNSICYAQLKDSEGLEKTFIWAIEDNSEKMTKVLIKGIINLKTKYINFRLVKKLCELRTYNDQQLLSLLKVLREFVKSNLKNYPKKLLTLLVNESSNNLNQEIRNVALNILILIKDAGEDLPSKVINHLDFECKLQNLLKSTDSHDIK